MEEQGKLEKQKARTRRVKIPLTSKEIVTTESFVVFDVKFEKIKNIHINSVMCHFTKPKTKLEYKSVI